MDRSMSEERMIDILAQVGLEDDAEYSEIFDAISTAPMEIRAELTELYHERLAWYDGMERMMYELSSDEEGE